MGQIHISEPAKRFYERVSSPVKHGTHSLVSTAKKYPRIAAFLTIAPAIGAGVAHAYGGDLYADSVAGLAYETLALTSTFLYLKITS